jgi:hypothetical protein
LEKITGFSKNTKPKKSPIRRGGGLTPFLTEAAASLTRFTDNLELPFPLGYLHRLFHLSYPEFKLNPYFRVVQNKSLSHEIPSTPIDFTVDCLFVHGPNYPRTAFGTG